MSATDPETEPDVLVDTADGVATITLNRPRVLNALRARTYDMLIEALETANADPAVGVLVITGAGDRAFSAGGDITEQRRRTPESGHRHAQRLMRLAAALRHNGKPVIAAVNGYAIGGGDEIHLMCDLTIAAERSRFGQTGMAVGMPPVWGGTQLLPALIGDKRAREAVYLGRVLTAAEAYELGMVNKVVPDEELMPEVRRWCDTLLTRSPQALRIAKTAFNYHTDLLQPAFNHALQLVALAYGSEEYLEGVTAFLEKRDPDFRRFRSGGEEANDE